VGLQNVDEIDTWGQFHQHFDEELILAQIPKGAKRQSSCQCLFAL